MVTQQQIEQAMIAADQAASVLQQITQLLTVLLTARISQNVNLTPTQIQGIIADYQSLKNTLIQLLQTLP